MPYLHSLPGHQHAQYITFLLLNLSLNPNIIQIGLKHTIAPTCFIFLCQAAGSIPQIDSIFQACGG